MFRRFLWALALLRVLVPSLCAADQVYFYHTDPAGTPLAMTDSGGTVVWKSDYKPFGEENSTSGSTANSKRFVGKEKDVETGFSYFGARYEDARTGRFIAPDQVRGVDQKSSKTNEKLLLNPQGLNIYAYALSNPYRYVDQDGSFWIPILSNLFLPSSANAPEHRYSPMVPSQSAGQFAFETALMETGGRITGDVIGMVGGEAPSVARSLGAAALKTYFPEVKMMAKIFGVTEREFHQAVKNEIIKDVGRLPKWLGKNPDVGISEPGNIVLRNVETKREFITNLTIEGFKR